MDQDLITDITLDHLPDLSDASVSFQIPPDAGPLLTDHTAGFDLLCNASGDDTGFAPLALRVPRGPPLSPGELTPRVQPALHSPPQPQSPSPPSVIPLRTLGHPAPSSIQRPPPSPLVSEERLDQLRVEVATLGQAVNEPSHVHAHVMQPAQHGVLEPPPLSCRNSEFSSGPLDGPPPAEDLPPEETNVRHDTRPPAVQDVVMHTRDEGPADATDIAVPRPKSKRNPRTTAKHTVAEGGVSKRPPSATTRAVNKTRNKPPSRVQEVHNVLAAAPRQITPPQSIATDTLQDLVPPARMSGDANTMSENTLATHSGTGGMAGRLVSYSQRLISSIGLYKSSLQSFSAEPTSIDAVRVADALVGTRSPAVALAPSTSPQRMNNTASAGNEPLRLSEISPHKPPASPPQSSSPASSGTLQDTRQHAVSPMRPAKKRVSMDADLPSECHRRKRGKTMPVEPDSKRGSSDEAGCQAHPHPNKEASHEEQGVTHPATRDNVRHPDASRPTLPSARTKYRPQFNFSTQCKGPTLDPFPYLANSRRVQETLRKSRGKHDEARSKGRRSASSLVRQDKGTRQEKAVLSSHARQPSGPTSAGDLPLIEKQNATLSVAPLTKPVGFTFRVDARLEARKAEERLAASEPGKTHTHVPDWRALRASHQAPLVSHGANVPSVPVVPFFFCTEQRAREREKFDAMVKRKEEEIERLKEAQRRREAEEEELAIKELRRKAIPKANDIPEWYADMPKRKGTAV